MIKVEIGDKEYNLREAKTKEEIIQILDNYSKKLYN